MGIFYVSLFVSFIILFFVNVVWGGINLYSWSLNGLQFLLEGMNFIERISAAIFLKWIILADIIWLVTLGIFLFSRKKFKTDTKLHYLKYTPIEIPTICVILPTYNEEEGVEFVIKDFQNQKNVKEVIVIDNHSSDNTVKIAKQCDATVIEKSKNMGISHSCLIGFKKALESDCNVIAITESDRSHNGYDLPRLVSFLDNCDEVIGTRQIQVLSEKGNQNGMLHVWGNMFLAKLVQLKYFSLQHMGILELTDIGCLYRCFRKKSLEKIIFDIEKVAKSYEIKEQKHHFSPFAVLLTMISVENDLKIIEVPVTFKKRVGTSKSNVTKKFNAISYGLSFIWTIIKR